jgi:hypothetical protein
MVCLWPGLPGAWYRGEIAQLLGALASGWLAMVLLMATFVWPLWFSPLVTRSLWFLATTGWLALTVWEHWRFAGWFARVTPGTTEAFAEAQCEYLQGNWFAAEATLLTILHDTAEDAEALLLLVSVLRRTRRWQPALRRLQQLELLDAARRWSHEIATERRLLQKGLEQSRGTQEDETAGLEVNGAS